MFERRNAAYPIPLSQFDYFTPIPSDPIATQNEYYKFTRLFDHIDDPDPKIQAEIEKALQETTSISNRGNITMPESETANDRWERRARFIKKYQVVEGDRAKGEVSSGVESSRTPSPVMQSNIVSTSKPPVSTSNATITSSKPKVQQNVTNVPDGESVKFIENYHSILKYDEKEKLVSFLCNCSAKLYSFYVTDDEIVQLLDENSRMLAILLNLPVEEKKEYPAAKTFYYKSKFNRYRPEEPSVRLRWDLKERIISSLVKNRQAFSNFPVIHNDAKINLNEENKDLVAEIFRTLSSKEEKIPCIKQVLVDDLRDTLDQYSILAKQSELVCSASVQKDEAVSGKDEEKSISSESTHTTVLTNGDKKKSEHDTSHKPVVDDKEDLELDSEPELSHGQTNVIKALERSLDRAQYDDIKREEQKQTIVKLTSELIKWKESYGKLVKKFETKEPTLAVKKQQPLVNKPVQIFGENWATFCYQVEDFEGLFNRGSKTLEFPFEYAGNRWIFNIESKIPETYFNLRTIDLFLKLKTPMSEPKNVKFIVTLINQKSQGKDRVYKRFLNFYRCEKFCIVTISFDDLVNNGFILRNTLDFELKMARL